ncbi:MAG: glycosyltransferase family 2 protein [Deltaproteobacteria bacterium]|nr:glycosyltransferase family 2 protein [Deltaproteobacteria bacterium]
MAAFFYWLKVFFKGIDLSGWAGTGMQHIKNGPSGMTRYLVDGEDPQFVLRRTFRAGWYVIAFSIEKDAPDAAYLYFDSGKGFNEDDAILVPFKNKSVRKRFFKLPGTCVGLRFDPVELPGEFSIRHFKLKAVPGWFAMKRVYKKLHSYRTRRLPDDPMDAYERLFMKPVVLDYQTYLGDIESRLITPRTADCHTVISIVMPVYNPDPQMLTDTIESILAQTYPHFELCIADDCSTRPGVIDVLRQYARRDARIKVVFREENGHISRSSNSALALCTGAFVALMDHDDLLPVHALNEVALAIEAQPDVNIVYTDEDKIDAGGKRTEPNFKPAWNPDLLYSQNYVSHLGVYRHALIKEVGGFREGLEGAQDHDLLLRCAMACGGKGIVHIPKVLYHWRVGEGSTALHAEEKTYTTSAGIRAVKEALGTRVADVIQGRYPNTYRVSWALPDPLPLVSLIMPTHNGMRITKRAIDSILELTVYRNYEIIVVDNNSDDPDALAYFDEIATHDKISVIRYPKPFNFSAINNFAVQHAKGTVLGFVNNDVEVITADWLREMVSHAMRPEIGCVGAKLYYADGRLQHAGVVLGIGGVAGHSHKYFDSDEPGYRSRIHLTQNYSAVTAACLLIRADIFRAVNGFNETELAVAFNDVDFCLKVRSAGYRNLWTPYAELYHHESVSRGAEDNPEKVKRFNGEVAYMIDTWGDALTKDPCYNPNLTLRHENFTLKLPEDWFDD